MAKNIVTPTLKSKHHYLTLKLELRFGPKPNK